MSLNRHVVVRCRLRFCPKSTTSPMMCCLPQTSPIWKELSCDQMHGVHTPIVPTTNRLFRSTRVVTKCCRSTLAVDHPLYNGKVVLVPADSCKLSLQPQPNGRMLSDIQPLARIYMQDWNLARDGPPPPAVCPVLRPDSTDADKEVYRCKFREASVHLPRLGVSLQALLARLGPVQNLVLTEGDRFDDPPRTSTRGTPNKVSN